MPQLNPYQKRGLTLILIMGAVAAAVAGTTLYVTWQAAMTSQRERLVETARSRARFIESVARFDRRYSADDVPGGAMAATLAQIRDAHRGFQGFGRTGEFTLAHRSGDRIVFLLSHRHQDLDDPKPVSWYAHHLAQPMRAALAGRSGTLIGTDYRGATVLAAFEPVAELDLGIVAKIDLAEVRAPFVRAGLWAGGIGSVLVLLGVLLFRRIGNPLVERLILSDDSLRIWESAFAFTANGILITDALRQDHPIVSCNPAFERITGYRAEEVKGRNCRFLQGDDRDQPEAREQLRRALREGRECQVVLRNYRKDGRLFWNRLNISPVKDGQGRIAYFLGIQEDITQRKRMEDELKQLAIRDRLTELLNRGEIERIAAVEIGRSKRYHRSLALLLLDIDHFKRTNDTWGHPIGDLVLRRFAATLRQTIRRQDQAGRYGGEEFLVILPETGAESALQLARRLCEKLREQPIDLGSGDSIRISVSIGVAVFPDCGTTLDRLVQAADRALYRAKATGRNRVCSALAPGDSTSQAETHPGGEPPPESGPVD